MSDEAAGLFIVIGACLFFAAWIESLLDKFLYAKYGDRDQQAELDAALESEEEYIAALERIVLMADRGVELDDQASLVKRMRDAAFEALPE